MRRSRDLDAAAAVVEVEVEVGSELDNIRTVVVVARRKVDVLGKERSNCAA